MKSDTLFSLMLEVGAQLGHYRIVSKIGAGGMGEVYFGVRKIKKG